MSSEKVPEYILCPKIYTALLISLEGTEKIKTGEK